MKKLSIIILGLFILVGCDLLGTPADGTPGAGDTTPPPAAEVDMNEGVTLDRVALAKCLTEKGAVLYAAEWCGHCQKQKAAFEKGEKELTVVECAEGSDWAEACTAAGVQAVPTWVFDGGVKKTGNTPLEELATLAGCEV